MKRPPTLYAKNRDGMHIAYQTIGDSSVDVVFLPEVGAAIDALWEHPGHLRWWRYHASFCRMIIHDPRGFGASDPVPPERIGRWDDWVEDMRAVMDAVGVEKAVILGEGFRSQIAVRLAVEYPERVRSLVLLNGCATSPWKTVPTTDEALRELVEGSWGTGALVSRNAPTLAGDPAFLDWAARFERVWASPATQATLIVKARQGDVRDLLPRLNCRTLVMHTGDLPHATIEDSRYLTEHMADARLLEIAPSKSFYLIEPKPGNEYEVFITGSRPKGIRERELATLLFTDIVGSTAKAAELGDERWHAVLGDVDDFARAVVERYAGRLIKHTGDGHLASFARPSDAIAAAIELRAGMKTFGVTIRSGIHTGEVEWQGDGAGGIAVHIAARVMSFADSDVVIVSASVPPLVAGSGFQFRERGTVELKGVPGRWQLYEVV